ncbi:MAG: hypothetical protein ACOCRX_11805 [Candidatus Woesearchaeota archaeon]
MEIGNLVKWKRSNEILGSLLSIPIGVGGNKVYVVRKKNGRDIFCRRDEIERYS